MSDTLPPAPTVGDFQTAEWDADVTGWWVIRDLTPEELAIKFPPPEPTPPGPVTRIERRQGLRALLGDGVTPGITRAMLEGMIASIENPVEREIALAEYEHTHWLIDSPFIMLGAANFGLTEEQVQALFEQAATL
jgi:hypothetical protein